MRAPVTLSPKLALTVVGGVAIAAAIVGTLLYLADARLVVGRPSVAQVTTPPPEPTEDQRTLSTLDRVRHEAALRQQRLKLEEAERPKLPLPTERVVDQELARWLARALDPNTQTDVAPEADHAVQVFQDPGHLLVNRAHVDLDRDGQVDERWLLEKGELTRQRSESDDGVWSHNEVWTQEGWQPAP